MSIRVLCPPPDPGCYDELLLLDETVYYVDTVSPDPPPRIPMLAHDAPLANPPPPPRVCVVVSFVSPVVGASGSSEPASSAQAREGGEGGREGELLLGVGEWGCLLARRVRRGCDACICRAGVACYILTTCVWCLAFSVAFCPARARVGKGMCFDTLVL